ncbi:MAG: hypothetical protein E7421_07165 [Ruminococcaceae bacterium]|nr:hypothetical protein [Oscillospiraceae bacterium]
MEDLTTTHETFEVVDIQFRPGQKVYFFDPAGHQLQAGDHVIIDTARGPEYGICTGGNHTVSGKDIVVPLRPVIRLANSDDEKTAAENQKKEKQAYDTCLEKIAEQKLDMQLVSAECAFDGSRILFFFTADERVDFRDLVKSLAGIFHTRIELRQIGVRDKAKMVGGLGICGRPFCCASFLDDFQPVSIKMAKTQNLSLNPTKISGTCGRLMCCLKYEQDAYEDLLRTAPKAESFVDTPEGRGTVIEVDLLRQRVKVKMENQPEVLSWFANGDIAVLRSGKAKKTDAPIPADLAPISGAIQQKKKEETEDSPVFLQSIRLRYSEETIAEETVAEPAPQEAAAETPRESTRQTHRRRPRNNRPAQAEGKAAPKQNGAAEGKAPKQNGAGEGKAAPKQNGSAENKKPTGRRSNYRRRRGGKPSGEKKAES